MAREFAPVVLHGVPDDRTATLIRDKATEVPGFALEGTPGFRNYVRDRLPRLQDVFVGPGFELRFTGAPPAALVNYVADADRCSRALAMVSDLARSTGAPCFNPPDAVAATMRDRSAERLAGADGVDMPRTLRLTPTSPDEVVRFALEHGLRFPLLVRIAGDHGGVSLIRLDTPAELAPLHTIPWGGRSLYLTEFRDFADADGRYRKMRVVVVGRDYFVRHLVIGNDWLLHAGRRQAADDAEESRFLARFDSEIRPRIDPVVRRIIDSVGLDFFGIDASLRPDGRLLVFEANACMNVLHNSRPSPNIWDAPIARILDALCTHLGSPQRWVTHSREAADA